MPFFSKNPVRNALCNALFFRGREFYTPPSCSVPCPTPECLYDFLTEKSCIYLKVMPEVSRESHEQVFEGFTLQEIIENHKTLLPRIMNEYTTEYRMEVEKIVLPCDVYELIDKFTRMDSPVKMAAYALKKLAHLKRYKKWNQ